MLCSLESDASFGSFTAVMLGSVARQLTGSQKLKISFTNHPLPIAQVFNGPGLAGQYAMFLEILMLILVLVMIARTAERIKTRFYDSLMMRGATKWSYWLAQYCVDVVTLLIPIPIFELSFLLFGIQVPGFAAVFVLFAVSEPLFQYVFKYTIYSFF